MFLEKALTRFPPFCSRCVPIKGSHGLPPNCGTNIYSKLKPSFLTRILSAVRITISWPDVFALFILTSAEAVFTCSRSHWRVPVLFSLPSSSYSSFLAPIIAIVIHSRLLTILNLHRTLFTALRILIFLNNSGHNFELYPTNHGRHEVNQRHHAQPCSGRGGHHYNSVRLRKPLLNCVAVPQLTW